MKLLFDENLSPRLVELLAAEIASLLAGHTAAIQTFDEAPEQSLLMVERRA
ncbi:MAG: hypothetical protein WDZ63_02545 [Burkholderiales bacterium]